MGPPSGALRECQPGSPRVAYRRMSNPIHHVQAARVGSTSGERDPLQLVEHSGDAAGDVTRFNKIATQGAPQMAVDKEAISLSRVYSYYSKFTCAYSMYSPP